MTSPGQDIEEPGWLRLLRGLVMVLTVTMIAGITLISYVIWSRYSDPAVPLPEVITLPNGTTAKAFTKGPDWFAVVTGDDEILIFDSATSDLRQRIEIVQSP